MKLILIAFFFFFQLEAQNSSNKTILQNTQLKNKTVELTFFSTKKFIIGGNIYLLHIGNQKFTEYKQFEDEKGARLIYLIPLEIYTKLIPKSIMFITYGETYTDASPDLDLTIESKREIGFFQKKSFKKF